MKTVIVPKDRLIDVIRRNRDMHAAQYREAYEGFVKTYSSALKKKLSAVESGAEIGFRDTRLNLEVPEDHTQDYDRTLAMLEWHQDETIPLSEQEYQNYIEDNWSWSGKFRQDIATYTVVS
jgi:hypothetical protein